MPPQLQNGISPVRTRGSKAQILTSGREKKTSLRPVAPQYEACDRSHDVNNIGNSHKHPQHLQGDLRVEYKVQMSNKNNGFNHKFDNNDQHSTSGGSAANSAATPSSVYMPSSIALSRDNMSDLSGVSGGTNRGSSSNAIPGQIFDPKFLMRPWKQAYNLSNVPPECKKNASSSGVNGYLVCNDRQNTTGGTSVWVAQNDVVEIFHNLDSSLGLDRFQIMGGMHKRIPVMILLMDPSTQSYELMQIWVDCAIDSIRDLVQVLQQKLPVKWKQAYDGLFQVRGHRFTQLINIIRLFKYDIQPHEILVAKPWSMAAKATIAIAGSAIRHLTRVGVISTDNDDASFSDKEMHRHRQQQLRNEDAPLLLSKRAQDRAYFPEGILDHHHAIQFITFSPTFEFSNDNDTQANTEPVGKASIFSFFHDSLCKSVSDSQYDVHSSPQASDSIGKRNPGILTLGVRRIIAGSLSRQSKPSHSFAGRDHKSKNNNEEEDNILLIASGNSDSNIIPRKNSEHAHKKNSDDDSNYGPVGCFSKLNCLRNSSIGATMKARRSGSNANPKPLPHASMTLLSEEEEKRWLAYSMKPIDEDQSLATGSIVSMSAPLLSPLSSQSAV